MNTEFSETKAKKAGNSTKKLTYTALFTALAIILNYFPEIPLGLPFAPWLKLDFSLTPILILSFLLGPVNGLSALLLTNLAHLLQTQNAGVGQLANVIMGAAYVLPAAFLYKKSRRISTATIGGLAGIILMTVLGVIMNKYLLVPLMLGDKINSFPMADYLSKAIVPFNLIKGSLNMAITLILYKRISALFSRQGKL